MFKPLLFTLFTLFYCTLYGQIDVGEFEINLYGFDIEIVTIEEPSYFGVGAVDLQSNYTYSRYFYRYMDSQYVYREGFEYEPLGVDTAVYLWPVNVPHIQIRKEVVLQTSAGTKWERSTWIDLYLDCGLAVDPDTATVYIIDTIYQDVEIYIPPIMDDEPAPDPETCFSGPGISGHVVNLTSCGTAAVLSVVAPTGSLYSVIDVSPGQTFITYFANGPKGLWYFNFMLDDGTVETVAITVI